MQFSLQKVPSSQQLADAQVDHRRMLRENPLFSRCLTLYCIATGLVVIATGFAFPEWETQPAALMVLESVLLIFAGSWFITSDRVKPRCSRRGCKRSW